jgi:hypothetical protein
MEVKNHCLPETVKVAALHRILGAEEEDRARLDAALNRALIAAKLLRNIHLGFNAPQRVPGERLEVATHFGDLTIDHFAGGSEAYEAWHIANAAGNFAYIMERGREVAHSDTLSMHTPPASRTDFWGEVRHQDDQLKPVQGIMLRTLPESVQWGFYLPMNRFHPFSVNPKTGIDEH